MLNRYLRLPQVLERIPVSRSTWLAGIQKGIFPKPVKLTPRTSMWKESDIEILFEKLDQVTDGIGQSDESGCLDKAV